jgi:CspA family cold shock protein
MAILIARTSDHPGNNGSPGAVERAAIAMCCSLVALRRTDMPVGTVKQFDTAKGHGIITPKGGGSDIFVHITAVELAGMKSLRKGESVTYEVERTPKGLWAKNLKAV